MADTDRATCPQCGVPLPADGSPGLCPLCLRSVTERRKPDTHRSTRRFTGAFSASRRWLQLLGSSQRFVWARHGFGDKWRYEPPDAEAVFNRGVELHCQGKTDEAIAAYREAIRIEPNHFDAHYNLGGALIAQGEPEKAIAEFLEAVCCSPDYAEAHYNLGMALRQQAKLDEAVAELLKARDSAQIDSKLAQAIEQALTMTDH